MFLQSMHVSVCLSVCLCPCLSVCLSPGAHTHESQQPEVDIRCLTHHTVPYFVIHCLSLNLELADLAG